MLTVKKLLIENKDEVLFHLSLDTEKIGYFSDWDRFGKGELFISKPWIGEVDPKAGTFNIMRSRKMRLITSRPVVEIFGRVTTDMRNIEIKLGVGWYGVLLLALAAIFFVSTIINNFNDWFAWAILLCLMGILLLLLELDLRKTEEKFIDYIDHVGSKTTHSNSL